MATIVKDGNPVPYHGVMKPKEEGGVSLTQEQYDLVLNPKHYGGKDNPYEAIKVIEAWGLHKSFNLGNVAKYLSRAGKKPSEDTKSKKIEDLKKARWYLDREITNLEKGIAE